MKNILAILLLIASFTASYAQEPNTGFVGFLAVNLPCFETEVALHSLNSDYDEIGFSQAEGVVNSIKTKTLIAGRVETFVNPETWKYSILISFDDGVSCFLTQGSDFQPK